MGRPKPAKLAVCPRLREVVESKLELRWSPQQIAAWLALARSRKPLGRSAVVMTNPATSAACLAARSS